MSIWSNVYTKVLMIARFSFTIISAFCVIVPTDATKIRVLVTGGTGTLGRSLVKGALNRDCDTYFTYRDLNKAQSLGADLSNGLYLDLANLNQVGFSISQNFECLQALPSFEDCDEYVLINNIGIGLSGHTQTALIKSLRINCLATVSVSEFLVDRLRKWLVSHSTRPKLTVINVSSGDGELVFLYSNIRQQIESLDSIKDWYDYIDSLMMKGVVTDGAGTPLSEYAVGPTPAYSLSKALLNTHTRLWHRQLISEGLLKSVRVMSVCPGNFQSPLSQPEELESSLPVDEAARHVLDLALGDAEGGLFYRYGQIIDC